MFSIEFPFRAPELVLRELAQPQQLPQPGAGLGRVWRHGCFGTVLAGGEGAV